MFISAMIKNYNDNNSDNDSFVKLYVDGSSNKKARDLGRLGIAWITVSGDTSPKTMSAKINHKKDQHQNHDRALIAEIMAATFALKSVPHGSKVILHTDHTEVSRIITDHDLWRNSVMNNKIKNSTIDLLAQILNETAKTHDVVIVEVTSDLTENAINREFMRQAHNAAIKQSGSKNYKPHPDEKRSKINAKTPIAWVPKGITHG